MSRPLPRPSAANPRLSLARRPSATLPLPVSQRSISSNNVPKVKPATAAARTSKTTQKLVLLPSDPQTKPLHEDEVHGYETDAGVQIRERKSAAERMSKAERRRAGFRRITAYAVAEGVRLKLLSSFLKREHNVTPRVYDNALYTMYHLPLLPGYGPGSNVRSSVSHSVHGPEITHANMSEAEENGYQGTYFVPQGSKDRTFDPSHGYIASSLGDADHRPVDDPMATDTEERPLIPVIVSGESIAVVDVDVIAHSAAEDTDAELPMQSPTLSPVPATPLTYENAHETVARPVQEDLSTAEVVFFDYGVVVFFGLDESQERNILDDISNAGAFRRARPETKWEIEELHYTYDPTIASPRIYNDFFTFKQPSHLLTLSIAHALAQSTLLAYYETLTHAILSDPSTTAIPQMLAKTGALRISRTNAMRLTGKLFKLRRDVVLIGNVLDVPDMFWEEASLRGLYDAVREYFEIGSRVRAVEERVAGARGLLDAIHDHLNNNAMERITWIIIWLIVAACLVEVGEVVARLVVHATTAHSSNADIVTLSNSTRLLSSSLPLVVQRAESVIDISHMSREEALLAVERLFVSP